MKVVPKVGFVAALAGAAALAFWLVARAPEPGATRAVSAASAAEATATVARAVDAARGDGARAASSEALAAQTAGQDDERTKRWLATIPEGDFRRSLIRLTPGVRARALAKLERVAPPKEDYASLRAAPDGALYYVCALVAHPSGVAAAKVASVTKATAAKTTTTTTTTTVAAASVPIATPPVRHSRAGAKNVLYLDFSGATIAGTRWNSTYGVTSYSALPFDLDGDSTTFSDAEQTAIVQIWERVAEDYAAFDVDVTTEEPATFTSTTGRAVITANLDASGVALPDSAVAAGVSFIDVFGDFDYAASSSPVFIYYTSFGGVIGNIAEAVSHEFGHNVGLSHDGTVGNEYYGGHGTGDISWGPIMGAPYGRNVTQWSKGEYYNANNTQDDLAIIAAHLGLRADEAGATLTTATAATVTTSGAVSAAGIFTSAMDVEVFALSTGVGTISLAANPYKAATGTNGGDADIKLELLNAAGTVVATSDPAASTAASLTYAATTAGAYYARLTPVGTGTPLASAPTGYTSYGSLGRYTLTGTVVATPPAITSATTASVGVGQTFSYAIVATGSPTSYGATGLPDGLAVDTKTGAISGRATVTGAFKVALSAGNVFGTAAATLTLTVTAAAPTIVSQTTGLQVVTPGSGVSLAVSAVSYPTAATYQWKRNGVVVTGATTNALAIASATTADSGFYQVLVTNATGTTASALMFVRVAPAATLVSVWGNNTTGQASGVPGGLTTAIAVAAGPAHVLALKRDGSVVGWGDNGVGQTAVPTGLGSAVAIAAGSYHSLALQATGTVVAWGFSSNGQAVVPSGLTNVVGIAAGYYHSLAVKADGTVVAWGDNTYGQSTVPSGLTNVIAVAAGRFDSWALKADGTVVGWGASTSGQLKIPTGLTGVAGIAAGAEHTVALKADGTVTVWGYNPFGGLPAGSGSVVAVAAGLYHTLAINAAGNVIAWGDNTQAESSVPAGLARVFAVAAGDYYSVALSDAGSTSSPSVATAPAFTVQPLSQTVLAGAAASFSATASGSPTPTYRWQISSDGGVTWTNLADGGSYSGTATGALTVTGTTVAMSGNAFRCVASNSVASGVASAAATLTVQSINTAPTITTIASQTINEDASTAALAFTVGDAQTAAAALTVTATSSNATLLPATGIVLGGSGASRTVKLTPAANANGSATITLTVSDGGLAASSAFTLTVNAVNDAPTISAVANQTLLAGAATTALAFTVGDAETAATSLKVTASSSNTSVVPAANVVLGGSGASRTVTVTAAKIAGTATITLTVSDGALTTSTAFTVTVTVPNTAPTITAIANQTVPQNTSTATLAFTVADAQTAAASLVVTAGSSNATLVPAANLLLGGSGGSRTIRVIPATGQTGTAVITVSVSDGSLGATTAFTLTVTPVNQAPTISSVVAQTILVGGSTGALPVAVADAETAATSLTLSASSSSTSFAPASAVVLGGSGTNRTVTVTPAAKTAGSATITLTVSDAVLKATSAFTVRTVASNDALADALTLNGTSATATAKNTTATKQTGEPRHAGNAGGHSVWWQWTAPVSGLATVGTVGSTFDTLLAVYTGTSVSALTAVGADDNSGGSGTSLLTFAAKAGTNYWIAVDGFGGATGTIALSLNEAQTAAAALPATLAAGVVARSQVLESAAETVTISTRIESADSLAALTAQVLLPAGWSLVAGSAPEAKTQPATGDRELLEWSWADGAGKPVTFTYSLKRPVGSTQPLQLDGLLQIDQAGRRGTVPLATRLDDRD